MLKLIKRVFMVGLVAVVLTACDKVPAGNAGILVNLYGSDKGVQVQEVGTGRYWLTWNEELFLFPTFTQTTTWTNEQSISFQTIEGMKVSSDVGITYRVDPTKVNELFTKYRTGIDEITNKFLRNMVRDAFNEKASTLQVETVYGAGKAELLKSVEDRVREQVEDIGIILERVYYASDLRLPQQVTNSLNAKIQATQMAEQRKNEVQQSKAEADKLRAQAQGEADAVTIRAEAEAKAIQLRADALRNSKDVILLNFIERWDGKLPLIMGAVDQMLNVGDILQKNK